MTARDNILNRPIPATGELMPVIGLGTWQTFDVAPGIKDEGLSQVLDVLATGGGRLIDSSPMYGRSEETVGRLTKRGGDSDRFFYATKVWTTGRQEGVEQMEESFRRFGRPVIDLMQIHNLVDWQTHLETLQAWKEAGRIRYIGITHYTDDHHAELERIISTHPIDFVQFNYSIFNRHAERRLLDAAAARGVATVINRPLGVGDAFRRVSGKALPGWAADYGIGSWSQYFLKYLISHPAVTCVIPATGDPAHMADNAAAGFGPLPDEMARARMANYIDSL
jgi:diketogulonate reductase-like aldo/keto reductase